MTTAARATAATRVLHFTAPADGEYIVQIRDCRARRRRLRIPLDGAPAPSGFPAVRRTPRNPNVPAGRRVPLTVTASRLDGFDGASTCRSQTCPPDCTPRRPHQTRTGLDHRHPDRRSRGEARRLRLFGSIGKGRQLEHTANPEDRLKLIALMPQPDLAMTAETKEVTLEPGGTAEITVSVARQGGFQGRIPVEVRNLPPRVRVLDVGLNGVLITEDESRRSFTSRRCRSASRANR